MGEKYDIVPVLEKETNTYLIQKFDEVKSSCEEFINERLDTVNLEKYDELTFKNVKEIRTEIRNRQDLVARARINCNQIAMGTFNEQAKTLETMLKEADTKLKTYVDTYNTEVVGKLKSPAKITLTVKGFDMKLIEKVKQFALKQGLEAIIK